MDILVSPRNPKEEKVLRAFLDSLEYEYSEEDIYIPPPPGAKRQTLEEYNKEIEEAEEEYKRGEYFTHEEVVKEFNKWAKK